MIKVCGSCGCGCGYAIVSTVSGSVRACVHGVECIVENGSECLDGCTM